MATDPQRAAQIDVLRRAATEMADEWSEHRAMGQDRIEWGTWRALIAWLANVADRMPYTQVSTPEQSHAAQIAGTYLGLIDPRASPVSPTTKETR